MLADKTLLSVTLAATFASGVGVGFAAKAPAPNSGFPPLTVSAIYGSRLAALSDEGYDDAEVAEARQAYTDYLKSYDLWWGEFLDLYRANTDIVDKKLEKRLEDLAARHRERTGAK